MKNYLLIIKADTNDADYIESTNVINDEDLNKFMPLIKAIKNFKPYKGGRLNYSHHHNFPIGECCRSDMGEKTPEEIYSDIDPELVEEFAELLSYSEYGTHTIASITMYEIVGEKRKLL